GPSLATGDQLKPDISAPGVDVLAAVAPTNHSGRMWDLESGTSMSSPHIAGLSLLIKQAHPDWTPDMIKSAMMTTAYDLKDPVDVHDRSGRGAGLQRLVHERLGAVRDVCEGLDHAHR